MNDKITALIPTYNRPGNLHRAILSVLRQTYDNLQVSIFDNASGDSTKEAVNHLSEHDTRIKYCRHAYNIGALANFKYAFNSVDTPYFSVLSDDDFLARDFYASAVNVFDNNPEVMFVILDTLNVDKNTNLLRSPVSTNRLSVFCDENRFDALHSGNIPITWTAMVFRKEVARIYDNMQDIYDVASDMRFLFHAAARYNFAYLSKVGAFYTSHPGSISAARKNLDLVHHAVQISRYIEIFNDKHIDPHIKDRAAFYLRKLLFESPYKAAAIAALKGIVINCCNRTEYTDKMVEMDIQNFRYEGYLKTSSILYLLYHNNLIRNIIFALFVRYKNKRQIKNKSEMLALQNGIYKELFDDIKEIG